MEKKSSRKLVLFVISLIIALLVTAMALMISPAAYIVLIVVCWAVTLIIKLSSKEDKKYIEILAAEVLFLLFTLSMPPLSVSSKSAARYTVQKSFLNLYRNITEPDWFPELSKAEYDSFSFSYLPSIMQGTGHFSVTMTVSPQQLEAYAAQYKVKAKYIIYAENFIICERMELSAKDAKIFGGAEHENTLSVYLDQSLAQCGGEVYVLDAGLNWNHPHSSAVLIDRENNRIQFSQLG